MPKGFRKKITRKEFWEEYGTTIVASLVASVASNVCIYLLEMLR